MTEKNKGIFLVVAAAAMFSTSGFLIKAVTADAFTVAFLRAPLAVLLLSLLSNGNGFLKNYMARRSKTSPS